ncbi:hypothetical protein EGH22_19835 [Halomicroarcula sp. F28]|nr:hypothetical protein [Halomicroarcula salinisoli]
MYQRHGRSDIDLRIDSEYQTLSGDEIAPHRVEELLADLSADGIDGEQLQGEFVSKSTMARHLKGCLDGSKETPPTDSSSEWEQDQIEISKDILQDKIEESLRTLENKGKIAGASEADVMISITMTCPECPTRVSLADALDRGYVCEHIAPAED